MNLVINWRAVMLLPYAPLRTAFLCCEKDPEIMVKLHRGFPNCFTESDEKIQPIPFSTLVETARELQRQSKAYSPFPPKACAHLGLPTRSFVWLGGEAVNDDSETLSEQVASLAYKKPAGSVIMLQEAAYVIVWTYLDETYYDSPAEELANRSYLVVVLCPTDYLSAALP